MNVAVSLMDGLGLDGDRCIRVIPRQEYLTNIHLDSALMSGDRTGPLAKALQYKADWSIFQKVTGLVINNSSSSKENTNFSDNF